MLQAIEISEEIPAIKEKVEIRKDLAALYRTVQDFGLDYGDLVEAHGAIHTLLQTLDQLCMAHKDVLINNGTVTLGEIEGDFCADPVMCEMAHRFSKAFTGLNQALTGASAAALAPKKLDEVIAAISNAMTELDGEQLPPQLAQLVSAFVTQFEEQFAEKIIEKVEAILQTPALAAAVGQDQGREQSYVQEAKVISLPLVTAVTDLAKEVNIIRDIGIIDLKPLVTNIDHVREVAAQENISLPSFKAVEIPAQQTARVIDITQTIAANSVVREIERGQVSASIISQPTLQAVVQQPVQIQTIQPQQLVPAAVVQIPQQFMTNHTAPEVVVRPAELHVSAAPLASPPVQSQTYTVAQTVTIATDISRPTPIQSAPEIKQEPKVQEAKISKEQVVKTEPVQTEDKKIEVAKEASVKLEKIVEPTELSKVINSKIEKDQAAPTLQPVLKESAHVAYVPAASITRVVHSSSNNEPTASLKQDVIVQKAEVAVTNNVVVNTTPPASSIRENVQINIPSSRPVDVKTPNTSKETVVVAQPITVKVKDGIKPNEQPKVVVPMPAQPVKPITIVQPPITIVTPPVFVNPPIKKGPPKRTGAQVQTAEDIKNSANNKCNGCASKECIHGGRCSR